MARLQAVLFDLDGTLLDSAPDICHSINQMLANHDRRPLSVAEMTPMLGDGAMALVQRAFEATGGALGDDIFPFVQEHIRLYRAIEPDPNQIYPGGRSVLEQLSKAGVKLGVCTNKQEAASKRVLSGLGLLDLFDFVAGGDTFEVHKPHPGHIEGVLRHLEVPRAAAAFVGDGPNDVIASERAGIPCVAVSHGYGDDVDSLGATRVIEGFDHLIPALREMGFSF